MTKILQTTFFLKDSKTSEENYYNLLGCVPPRIMTSNAFLVGEADDHGGEYGSPRYGLYFTEGGEFYYGGKTTLKEFMLFLVPDLPEQGKQYALTGSSKDRCISNGNTWRDSEVKNTVTN